MVVRFGRFGGSIVFWNLDKWKDDQDGYFWNQRITHDLDTLYGDAWKAKDMCKGQC